MRKLLFSILVLSLSACATKLPNAPQGYSYKQIKTPDFAISVYENDTIRKNKLLRFYIEGSGTPNPDKTIALTMAQKDNFQNSIVLMRPCQFDEENKLCTTKEIWTTHQFSPEILEEYKMVIDYYAKKHKASKIEFIAYDSGATVALLLASRLNNVSRVITIGGILDIDEYAQNNNLPAFQNAQNPAQNYLLMEKIPQVHYVGDQDEITTKAMAEKFVKKLPHPVHAVVKVVPDTDHENWGNIDLDY